MKHILLTATIILSACGSNVFEPLDSSDPAEAASIALENEEPEQAIEILESAIDSETDQERLYTYQSLLGSAKAQLAGLDLIAFALKLISSDSASNPIISLFSAIPDATPTNIALVEEAISLLASIPEQWQLASDLYQLSMFSTALMSLQTKVFDLDGDGQLSAEELSQMSEDQAASILSSLTNADTLLSAGGSAENEASSESVSSLLSQIQSQPGSSDSEKLRSFLGN